MKNAFVLSSLFLIAGYPAALAAETIGIISLHLPDAPIVIGTYAAVGVLAFAFRDYSRHTTPNARHTAASAPQAELRPLPMTNSPLQAN